MNRRFLKRLSTLMAVLLLAVFTLEKPLLAAFEAIKVNVGGQTIQVTPGEWIAVRQGTQVVHYNVRYIDGKPVALEMSQYLRLIFGGDVTAGQAAAVPSATKPKGGSSSVGQSQAVAQSQSQVQAKPTQSVAQNTNVVSNQSAGSVAPNKPNTSALTNQQAAVQGQVQTQTPSQVTQQSQSQILSQFQVPSGSTAQQQQISVKPTQSTSFSSSNQSSQASTQSIPKTQADAMNVNQSQVPQTQTSSKGSSVSWIKEELSNYGQQIKESFQSGKTTGQEFGTKTVDSAKNIGEQAGNKIGDLLRGAKERFAKLFKRTPASPKSDSFQTTQQSSQSGQSGQSMQGQHSSQSSQQSSQQVSQSQQTSQSQQSTSSGQTSQTQQTSQSTSQTTSNQSSNNQSSTQTSNNQSSTQTSQQSQQVSQSQQTNQGTTAVSGQFDQSQTSAQSIESDQLSKKPGFFDKTKESFKTGYDKGKAMANQGIQNVKDSLKAGFSPKNILVTAGITVAVDLGMQIMRGEKPSLQKALKTVCSAEFAGGVTGSVLGAAAGSFFVPFLSAVPVVGGFLSALAPTFGSVVGSSVGAYLAGDLKNGRFSIRNAFRSIDWVGVTGQSIGSVVGTMLGSMIFPPFGTIVGGIVGGMVGNWAAHKIAALFGRGKGFGSIAMPVGTNPYADAGQTLGSIGIGAVAGSTEIPVHGNQTSAPVLTIEGNVEPIGTYASEIQLAYAKYQELYRLYNELLAQGRQSDAVRVAQEMNKAKAEYEALKAKAGIK